MTYILGDSTVPEISERDPGRILIRLRPDIGHSDRLLRDLARNVDGKSGRESQ